MKTRIYGEDLNEMLLEAEYPDWFKDPEASVLERTFSADIFLGKGDAFCAKRSYGDGFRLL